MALHGLARLFEWGIERVLRRDGPPILRAYRGYAEPGALVLQGRVLSSARRGEAQAGQSAWTNIKQMVSLFVTTEVDGVTVRASGVTVQSDAEGYVTLRVPRPEGVHGWIEVPADLPWSKDPPVRMPVLVPGPDARFGVISDIDDTVLHTGAHTLWRNLWTTFSGNAMTRQVYGDAVALMARLSEGGRNPVFYVSSSPWNLFSFLEKVFARAGLVPGPMFLRDLGVSERGLIGAGHLDHKGSSIDRILAGNPGLRFWLVGDTGQKDAQVYAGVVSRHPGRIGGVILRDAASGLAPATQGAIDAIEAAGVPVQVVPQFGKLSARVLPGPEEGSSEGPETGPEERPAKQLGEVTGQGREALQ